MLGHVLILSLQPPLTLPKPSFITRTISFSPPHSHSNPQDGSEHDSSSDDDSMEDGRDRAKDAKEGKEEGKEGAKEGGKEGKKRRRREEYYDHDDADGFIDDSEVAEDIYATLGAKKLKTRARGFFTSAGELQVRGGGRGRPCTRRRFRFDTYT